MLTRRINFPNKSFLLLGPRGTGKSTWLAQQVHADLRIDLLESDRFLELSRNPAGLRDLTRGLKAGSWVIIDEIQRVPLLLSEVHKIYEEQRLHFALSGSSARKLKRAEADLLAGRALQLFMFPLVYSEYAAVWTIAQAVEWGSLPLVVAEPQFKEQTLATYVETYLKEEIAAEALVRNLDPFLRFLQTAGLYNAQLLNIENIARESMVKRTTVDRYFQILEDTLLAFRLPAYRAGIKAKEVVHPKFYFFDTGIARACSGLLHNPLDNVWRGFAFEALLLHELRAYNAFSGKQRKLAHFTISGSYDIDFIVELTPKTLSAPSQLLCIEAKLANKWNRDWNKPMHDFAALSKSQVVRKIGVYTGQDRLLQDDVEVMPVDQFLKELMAGGIIT